MPMEDERLKEIEDETVAAQKNSPAGIMRSQTNMLLAEVKRLRAREDTWQSLLLEAARSLLSYDASYGGGGGSDEALEIARHFGYDGGSSEIDDWLRAAVAAEGESEDAT
jgi:hypothetical protein